ncbi:MAG: hypothetical protein PHH51_02700 [Bacilli bacterium]|nr:hypothetical protein [Bacilli bacterium]MDD3895947.1 hypothetical protein [Bacilli bacterium]MDD4407512.1 hypothetical protein [Bacilli bacterium]
MNKKEYQKKYIQLFLLLLGIILITVAASNLYRHYLENQINNSYISKHVANIQYNEIQNAMLEFSSDTFLYISYTGDSNIRDLEVKLKKVLRDNDLIDNMVYLNINDLMENENYIDKLNKILGLKDIKISNVPAIIYFKDNKVIDIIDSKNSQIDVGRFTQLLEKYEIISEI